MKYRVYAVIEVNPTGIVPPLERDDGTLDGVAVWDYVKQALERSLIIDALTALAIEPIKEEL